jgi:phage-related protein
MAGVEITWNSVSSSTIPGLVFTNPKRQLLGNHRGSFLEIPGRRGSWYFPELRGRRSIKVDGFVLQETGIFSDRRDSIVAMADWLDVDIQARLILGDDPSVYYEAVLGDCGDTDEWRDLGTFQLEWLVSPFSFATTVTNLVVASAVTTNTVFDPDILTPTLPVIEVKPTNGNITDFYISINGEALSWQGSLASGNTITIDTNSVVVTTGVNTDVELTGAYDPAAVQVSGVSGSFPYLVPGINTYGFHINTGTATAVTVTIKYRKAYRK